jgi:hypothetical protein
MKPCIGGISTTSRATRSGGLHWSEREFASNVYHLMIFEFKVERQPHLVEGVFKHELVPRIKMRSPLFSPHQLDLLQISVDPTQRACTGHSPCFSPSPPYPRNGEGIVHKFPRGSKCSRYSI